MPLGTDFGGPLFFTHYSYLGLDPRGLKDSYADYGEQMKAHTLINRAYCIDNPKKYKGYGRKCWGLTASDNHQGYSAHCPQNDLGVITPTAAISSIPYTPEHSLEAMRYFYEELGDRLWGEYGFKDAFNLTENWFASSYLAIDQGPIIVMIENYRSGLDMETLHESSRCTERIEETGVRLRRIRYTIDYNHETTIPPFTRFGVSRPCPCARHAARYLLQPAEHRLYLYDL